MGRVFVDEWWKELVDGWEEFVDEWWEELVDGWEGRSKDFVAGAVVLDRNLPHLYGLPHLCGRSF